LFWSHLRPQRLGGTEGERIANMAEELETDQSDRWRAPAREKRKYLSAFYLYDKDWKFEAVWDDAYYEAAKRLIEGVAKGEYLPAYEGVAGLYLFRHYLEIGLKLVIFHSRWLRDAHANAAREEIEDVKKTHSLKVLWDIAKNECHRIMPAQEWGALDTDFLGACIREFDTVDPDGERFRYHGPRFGVEKDPSKRKAQARTITYKLQVNFAALVDTVEHAHDILDYLDSYMIETYGQNEEWERTLRSL